MLLEGKHLDRRDKGMIKVRHKGNFRKIENFFERTKYLKILERLNKVGEEGVRALSAATPKRTGKTAASWSYEVTEENGRYRINWFNSNVNKGVNIALIIQTGHGTGTGAWVEGIDYINPAVKELFVNLADDVWREVIKL